MYREITKGNEGGALAARTRNRIAWTSFTHSQGHLFDWAEAMIQSVLGAVFAIVGGNLCVSC